MQMTQTAEHAGELVLQCRALTRCYGGRILANDQINFDLRRGEVHALLGENGAGKSTLMKMLYGIERPDSGEILVRGEAVKLKNSAAAIACGIGMVHQELMLIPYLTVVENIVLGQEIKTPYGRLNNREACRRIRELAQSYGLDIDPEAQVQKLTIGQRQRVEIIKLLYRKADILIFDEPTALLTPQESDALFDVLRKLKSMGKSIIFITHKLREVYQIADRMTVMRNGHVVGTTTPQETDETGLTRMMVGRDVSRKRRQPHPIGDESVLEVRDLQVAGPGGVDALNRMSFSIKKGEILGVAGIEGNGQTQLAQAIIGLTEISGGSIRLCGEELKGRTTKAIRELGVGSIPDDRQGLGLLLTMKVYENLMLNSYDSAPFAKNAFYQDWGAVRKTADETIASYSIQTAGGGALVGTLSGGNQQKVVVGRELAGDCRLLIAAQPTRGVDIASADYIQMKLLEAAEQGSAVLLISSDLDELMKISDRILVLFRGSCVGIVDGDDAGRELLGQMMLGGSIQAG